MTAHEITDTETQILLDRIVQSFAKPEVTHINYLTELTDFTETVIIGYIRSKRVSKKVTKDEFLEPFYCQDSQISIDRALEIFESKDETVSIKSVAEIYEWFQYKNSGHCKVSGENLIIQEIYQKNHRPDKNAIRELAKITNRSVVRIQTYLSQLRSREGVTEGRLYMTDNAEKRIAAEYKISPKFGYIRAQHLIKELNITMFQLRKVVKEIETRNGNPNKIQKGITAEQEKRLIQCFEERDWCNQAMSRKIGKEIGLSGTKVHTWFKERRKNFQNYKGGIIRFKYAHQMK